MASNLPAIILVHGFRDGATHWSKATLELKRPGYDNLHAIELPLASLADDAEWMHKMITWQQGPVLLTGHSYGGTAVTEAGNQPNMVGLVYTAAFAPNNGGSPGGVTQEYLSLVAVDLVPDSDGYLRVKVDRFHESFHQGFVADEGPVTDITQKAPSVSTFSGVIGSPAWKSKPFRYQISSADHMIVPENQERMAARTASREIVALDANHASLASWTKEVVTSIDEVAVATAH